MSKMAFNDDSEKEMVTKVFESAIEMLSEEDRKMPQITNLLPLFRRGIGVHHSGLLPILKETIEILFQEGLIKALFATETFSIADLLPAERRPDCFQGFPVIYQVAEPLKVGHS